jgi:hypothetical protein
LRRRAQAANAPIASIDRVAGSGVGVAPTMAPALGSMPFKRLVLPSVRSSEYNSLFATGPKTGSKANGNQVKCVELASYVDRRTESQAGGSEQGRKACRRVNPVEIGVGRILGSSTASRSSAAAALKISNDKEAEYGAAFGMALAGNSVGAQALIDDLQARFPEDTSVRFSYLPSLQALLAVNRGEPLRAIEILQVAVPYELGTQRSWIHGNFRALYPVCVRGLAYLAEHNGEEAAAEFQKNP